MSTLSQTSPIRRLSLLRRLPFWAQALALCALFAIVGVAVLDDYGVGSAEPLTRKVAAANAAYIATLDIGEILRTPSFGFAYRYNGIAFEMPLLLAERALGLQDIRHIYLMRHLLAHLLFIAGGFACGMLAYRMIGSRWIALFAMLMFLLHPRLYAHSFFNIRDIPFAVALLFALYLAHRAFRKDTIGAFLLCGIAVGVATELRVFGLMLLPMILAMRALDLWRASGSAERNRILMTGATFSIAALATVCVIHPYYWENPLRFIEGIRFLSQRSTNEENLFMGEIYLANAVPWNYIPVWFAITAPPLTLLLGALGAAAACWQAIARPLAALRDRETRFRVLLLGCIALPVTASIVLQSSVNDGWRQMYFLWAPFCLLAAVGLRAFANIRMERGIWKIGDRLPDWVRGGAPRRALAYGVVGAGLITTATAMAALHPHQQVYFNALVDTKTPGALAKRYDMDYWQMAHHQLLERLLARYPDDKLRVWLAESRSARLLPQTDQRRIVQVYAPDADFYLNARRYHLRDTPEPPRFHSIRAYGSDIAFTIAPNSDAYRDYYRAEYDDVEANGTLLARSAFDIYAHNGALHYLSANCAPLLASPRAQIFLHIFPDASADLPADLREYGFENRDFWLARREAFFTRAAFFDNKCVIRRPLPDYPIARIRTGQDAAASGGNQWRADIDMAAHAAAQALYDHIAAGDYGAPIAHSRFNLYLSGDSLAYLKEPCLPGDAEARFFLHIFPADPADLPANWREYGFVNLDFQFADRGADIVGKCVAARKLPDYPIARIRTGQSAPPPGGDEWREDIDLADLAAEQAMAQALYESIAAGDYGAIVAQSRFHLYLNDNALTYLKAPCAPGDDHARFFLHIIPASPSDLPAASREAGFANLDFQFADRGAHVGNICVATLDLPDYPIDRIRTGQFVRGEGQLWSAEFPPAR